jgi:hypothetical protein
MIKEIESSQELEHRQHLRILLTPSTLSLTLCLLSVAAILGFGLVSYINRSGIIYQSLFGITDGSQLHVSSNNLASGLVGSLFANHILNEIVLFVFWNLVGLFTYCVLYISIKSFYGAWGDIQELRFINVRKDERAKILGLRVAVRVALVLITIIYGLVGVKIIVPISVIWAQSALLLLQTLHGLFYGLLSLIVLFLYIHILVIILRLLFLRVRLFGSNDFVEQ